MRGSVNNTEMVTFGNVLAPMKMGVLCFSGKRATQKVIKSPYSKEKPFSEKRFKHMPLAAVLKISFSSGEALLFGFFFRGILIAVKVSGDKNHAFLIDYISC